MKRGRPAQIGQELEAATKSKVTVTPAQKASGLRQKAVSWRNQLGEFKKYLAKNTPDERPKELVAERRALKKAVDELLAAW